MCEFTVGAKFSSYLEVAEKINKLGSETLTAFWKREARTIGAIKSKLSRHRQINPELVYYQLMYTCSHGGQKFRKKGKNLRQTSTNKKDCKVHVRFKASLDGRSLEVTSVNLEHNHETSKMLYVCHKKYSQEPRLQKMSPSKPKPKINLDYSGMSYDERRQEALAWCSDIPYLMARVNGDTFEQRLKLIQSLKLYWSSEVDVGLSLVPVKAESGPGVKMSDIDIKLDLDCCDSDRDFVGKVEIDDDDSVQEALFVV